MVQEKAMMVTRRLATQKIGEDLCVLTVVIQSFELQNFFKCLGSSAQLLEIESVDQDPYF
jgi:hypothetical protein